MLPNNRLVSSDHHIKSLEFLWTHRAVHTIVYTGGECASGAMLLDLFLPIGKDGERHDCRIEGKSSFVRNERALPINVHLEKSGGTSLFVAIINASMVSVFPFNREQSAGIRM
jgi:hypothetical protein